MARVDLQVPYAEKDEAKRLSARWEPKKKVWYVPSGIDKQRFARWLNEFTPTVRAKYFYVAEAPRICWKCTKEMTVYAIMLPCGFEEWEESETKPGIYVWEQYDYESMLSFVYQLDKQTLKVMQSISKHYLFAYSKTMQDRFFFNHCPHCRALQGDFFLHNEPGGSFFPTTQEDANRIQFQRISQPIEVAAGSQSMGAPFMDIE